MKKGLFYKVFTALLAVNTLNADAQSVSMKAVVSCPFPRDIASAAKGAKSAVSLREEGKRNVYVAEAPVYNLRKLTNYTKGDWAGNNQFVGIDRWAVGGLYKRWRA